VAFFGGCLFEVKSSDQSADRFSGLFDPTKLLREQRMILAYLDPVTGSAIVQVLLGALAVVGLGWQYVRKGFKTLFRREANTDRKPETEKVGS
jgi:hypothetical protein